MTGEEHYREAERLLAGTERSGLWGSTSVGLPTPQEVSLAQVHATLALAAAQSYVPGYPGRERYGAVQR